MFHVEHNKRKHMQENSKESGQIPQSGATSSGKTTQASRLGRGLGSLIPPAPQQPFQPVPRPVAPRAPVQQIQSPVESTAVKVSNPVQAVVASVAAPERSTGNIPENAALLAGTAVVELNISFIARNTRQPREKFDDRAIESLAD